MLASKPLPHCGVDQPLNCSIWHSFTGKLYQQRAAGSSGIALGALALPCVLAGLTARQLRGQTAGGSALLLLACAAASAASLVSLLWQLQHGARMAALQDNGRKRRQGSSRTGSNGSSSSAAIQGALAGPWLPLALLAVVGLASWAAASSGGLSGAVTVLAAAAAAVGCQQALLAGLPGVFTAGEALVAGEAAVLLLGSALVSLQQSAGKAQRHEEPYSVFVLLLTAGSVAAAALLFPLLLWRQRAAMQKASRGQSTRFVYAVTAAATVVTLLAAACAVPAALWALGLALSSHRRLLVCGWWAGVMAAALPIMGWLSRSGHMRGILGKRRKLWLVEVVWSGLWNGAPACARHECRLACSCCAHRLLAALSSCHASAQGLPPAGSLSLPARPADGAPAAGRCAGRRLGAAAGGGGCSPVRSARHR